MSFVRLAGSVEFADGNIDAGNTRHEEALAKQA